MRTTPVLATPVLATLATLSLALQGCSSAAEPAAPGTPSPASAETSAAAPETGAGSGAASGTPAPDANYEQILDGKRKAIIHIAEDDKDWSATYEGPIAIGGGTDDGALFRLVPAKGDNYLIEALRAREEGGRWCVTADARDEPVSLGTEKCAEKETMLFTITPTGKKDDKGRATHWINHDRYGRVQVKNDGSALYIQEIGESGRGTYSFVDRGAV